MRCLRTVLIKTSMQKSMKKVDSGKSVKSVTRLVNSVSSLASSGTGLIKNLSHKAVNPEGEVVVSDILEDNVPQKKDGVVLDSASSIQNWLTSVRPEVSPAIAEAIQGQLYVLSFVQTPTMAGMAVDNLIFCLDKSLKKASYEEEKAFIRETFCSMIQNLMFIGDARLAYAIEKNREEAGALLIQAGDILNSTISAIASSVSAPGAAIPQIANIFENQVAKEGFFKKIGSWISKKKEIESKKADYYLTISNMFKVLDRYSSLIGPSILICGMLERYRPAVISYYREQLEKDVKERSGAAVEAVSSIIVASGQLLDSIWNPKKLGSNVQKAGKTIGKIKYGESLSGIEAAEKRMIADLAVAQKMEKDIRKVQEETHTQLEQASALQFAKKKELRDRLKELDGHLGKAVKKRQDTENKLLQLQELIKQEQPKLEELRKMDEDFLRITEKFAVEL